jgi:hypothetical protein
MVLDPITIFGSFRIHSAERVDILSKCVPLMVGVLSGGEGTAHCRLPQGERGPCHGGVRQRGDGLTGQAAVARV